MEGRTLVLILDNCSTHIQTRDLANHGIVLKNTKLLYLPPDTTSKIQPCDAGIIRIFKVYYKKCLNEHLLAQLEAGARIPEKITLLEGINMVVATWKHDVHAATTTHCIDHCKLTSESAGANVPHLDNAVEEEL